MFTIYIPLLTGGMLFILRYGEERTKSTFQSVMFTVIENLRTDITIQYFCN